MTPSTSLTSNASSTVSHDGLDCRKASAADSACAPIYVLEHEREFVRLEEQAKREGYRCAEEFGHINIPAHARVLDAGCGSGLLSRYLAARFPSIAISGVDASKDRIEQAKKAARSFQNIDFHCANLRSLPFAKASFDFIFCRYVIHHMPSTSTDRMEVLREFYRCLKPGGKVVVAEPDALFYNLFPQTKAIERAFSIIQERAPVDLCVGKKLGELLSQAGFAIEDWSVQTIASRKELLSQEHELMRDRFDQLKPFLESMLDGPERAAEFRDDFLGALLRPETIYYCNKLIVTGLKAH